MLAERLGNDDNLNSGQSTSGIFVCAVCQVDLAPSEGISVHAGSIFSTSSKPWQGPFLCSDCRDKKDAMEGKRPSGVKFSQKSHSVTMRHEQRDEVLSSNSEPNLGNVNFERVNSRPLCVNMLYRQ
ncbi:putative protein phosphatase 2C 15, partial [Mucuna pruriens]